MIAVEDADVEQVLENDVKCRNEIAYDFVGDVVWDTGFPVLTFLSMSATLLFCVTVVCLVPEEFVWSFPSSGCLQLKSPVRIVNSGHI